MGAREYYYMILFSFGITAYHYRNRCSLNFIKEPHRLTNIRGTYIYGIKSGGFVKIHILGIRGL